MSCSLGLEVTARAWPTLCREIGSRCGEPTLQGLMAVSAASAVGIAGQGVTGLVAPRWAGACPHQGQHRPCPGPVCPPCPSSGRPLALRVWWRALPPPPAPTTFSFPQTPARRGPTAVPTRLPLLPPLGCRGSSPSGRWGLEVGVPGSSPLQGFGSGEVPRQGTRVAGLGGTYTCAQNMSLLGAGSLWGSSLPLCAPLPSWAPPFLPPSCPSLKPRATPAPWEPSRSCIWTRCSHERVLSCPTGCVAWATGPACGLRRPCPDESCKFSGGQGSPDIPFPRTGGSLLVWEGLGPGLAPPWAAWGWHFLPPPRLPRLPGRGRKGVGGGSPASYCGVQEAARGHFGGSLCSSGFWSVGCPFQRDLRGHLLSHSRVVVVASACIL